MFTTTEKNEVALSLFCDFGIFSQDQENFLIHGELTETNKALIFFSELGSNLNFLRCLLNR